MAEATIPTMDEIKDKLREVKDPRVGNVTITAVELAQDLSTARVFFVPFASTHSNEEVRAGLTRAGGFLRGEAGRRLSLRHAPRLEFVFDESIEKAAHLTDLRHRGRADQPLAAGIADGDDADAEAPGGPAPRGQRLRCGGRDAHVMRPDERCAGNRLEQVERHRAERTAGNDREVLRLPEQPDAERPREGITQPLNAVVGRLFAREPGPDAGDLRRQGVGHRDGRGANGPVRERDEHDAMRGGRYHVEHEPGRVGHREFVEFGANPAGAGSAAEAIVSRISRACLDGRGRVVQHALIRADVGSGRACSKRPGGLRRIEPGRPARVDVRGPAPPETQPESRCP